MRDTAGVEQASRVAQTRAVLDQHASQGGRYNEVVIPNSGHSPFIEEPGKFAGLLKPIRVEADGKNP